MFLDFSTYKDNEKTEESPTNDQNRCVESKERYVFSVAGYVVSPAGDEGCHVGGDGAVEVHLLSSGRVNKPQCLGMQSLSWAHFEAVVDELCVTGRTVSPQDLVASVAFVIEERMPHVLHVHADLVGASSLELALYQRHVQEVFEGVVVCDGMLSLVTIWKHAHGQSVAW